MNAFFKKIFSPILWGNLLAMGIVTALLILGVKFWLGQYTHHGEEIEVPNVKNKMPDTAMLQLEQLGLTAVVADSSYDRTLPAGIIMEQKPMAGAHVKAGREVRLTINSRNAPTMVLPDILGNSSTREAQERLKQLGFKLGETQYVSGDKDWVYGMLVNGRPVYNGDRVAIGATVTLQVGHGYLTEDSLESTFEDEELTLDGDIYDYE